MAGVADAKTKVVIGQLNWPGSTAIETVLGEIMTRYLDADVETISAAQEALYEGLDKGDGSVDIVADMWTDHLPAQMKSYVLPGGKGTIILNATPYLGTGHLYSDRSAEANGIKQRTERLKWRSSSIRTAMAKARSGPAKSAGNRRTIRRFGRRPMASTRRWN
jgi:hypothetical protein